MNKYLIEQKIKTLAELEVGLSDNSNQFPKMKIDEYVFTQWNFNFGDGWLGDAWLVHKNIEAKNYIDALNIFRRGLDKIVQKLGFISQCYMDFYQEPFMCYRLNNNIEKVFFYRHIQTRKGVPLMFRKEELLNYKKLQNFKFSGAFRFLQESRNVVGYIPKLVLLFSSLEAMCEKVQHVNEKGDKYFTYNKETMKKILGGRLMDELFGNNGIRHKLNHGEIVESIFEKNYVDEIYNKIVHYFNQNHGMNIDTDIKSPQRNFNGNKQFIDYWLKPERDNKISLINCANNFKQETKHIEGFKHLHNLDIEQY